MGAGTVPLKAKIAIPSPHFSPLFGATVLNSLLGELGYELRPN